MSDLSRGSPTAGRDPNVRPFSSGTEAMDWQEANCERCMKNGYKRGGEVCAMEHAISLGFITGTVTREGAEAYGYGDQGRGFEEMPCQCSQFAPPLTCEYIPRPSKRKSPVYCGKPAASEHAHKGRRFAVCEKHAKKLAGGVSP